MMRLLRTLALIAPVIDMLVIIVAKTFLGPVGLSADTSAAHLARGSLPFLVATAFLVNPTVAVLGLVTARSCVQMGWVIGLLTLLLLGVYAVPLIGAMAPHLPRDALPGSPSWALLIATEVFAMPAALAVLRFTFISSPAALHTT
jgi:hypothetical protein